MEYGGWWDLERLPNEVGYGYACSCASIYTYTYQRTATPHRPSTYSPYDIFHSLLSAGLSGDASLGELPVVDRLSLAASPQFGRVAVPFSAASSGSSANTSKFEPKNSRERAW